MNRMLVAAIGLLPIAAVSLLPTVASAQAVLRGPVVISWPVTVDRPYDDRRDDWRNRNLDRRDDWRNRDWNRRDNDNRSNSDRRDRRDGSYRYDGNRRDNQRRVWIPGHWEPGFLGLGRKWVEGHYAQR